MGEISHNCGFCVTHGLSDAYSFIKDLQHRGREAAGIAAIGDRIDIMKWKGTVDAFDVEDLYKIFPAPVYHTFMAHVRYATRGRKEEILRDAHPHVIGGEVAQMDGDHVIVRGCEAAVVHNGQVSSEYFAGVDRSLLKTGCDTEALLHLYRMTGASALMRQVPGAYTMAIADNRLKDVVVMRDRTGIKPGVLGQKDGKCVVASEDIALRRNHASLIENLEPGTVYYLDSSGRYEKERVVNPARRLCFFELNYIAHRDSNIDGISVRFMRELLGRALADEFSPEDVEIVSFLPRCPEPAAMSYAERTGKEFKYMFYKRRAERSFQGSTDEDRQKSNRNNLFLLDGSDVKGRKVLVVDDSVVRGNSSKRGRDLLRGAGANKIYYASYTPPIGIIGADGVPRGCMFGVDMPPEETKHHKFIARGKTLEEIGEELGISIAFLSPEGMLKAYERVGIDRSELCTYCIGGSHPFELLQIEEAG